VLRYYGLQSRCAFKSTGYLVLRFIRSIFGTESLHVKKILNILWFACFITVTDDALINAVVLSPGFSPISSTKTPVYGSHDLIGP